MPPVPPHQRSPFPKVANQTASTPTNSGVVVPQRQGDRDSGDGDDGGDDGDGDDGGDGGDGDDDGGEAKRKAERKAAKLAKSRESLARAGFPIFLKFVDLEAAGIVASWAQLGNLIRDEKFPQGILLSNNTRVWRMDTVTDWLASRPTGRLPPEGKLRERDRRASAEVQ